PILRADVSAYSPPDAPTERFPALQRLAARSYILVPLVARGRVLGAVTLMLTREGANYTEADLEVAEQLADRCALAIDNAGLYAAEREARLRASFLAEAGAILDSSLDYEETLANVARIAVPELADWCAVSIVDDEGRLREVATAHVDPEQRALARELNDRWPPEPDSPGGAPAVARTGVTQFVPEITDEMLVEGIPDPEQLALVRRLGLRSIILAPLRARGRTLGVLTLANAESGRLFGEADVQFCEELARRAGMAIDNARLYTERTRIAHTLQAKLLPERLPQIPGTLLAARYRAAGELNEVGGDFYDVFQRSDSEWALVVGDVSGKGAEAAAVTALARYTLRAAALDEASPSDALRRLNAAMLGDPSGQFATVVLAYAAADGEGALRLRMALGGHPPPLVLRAGGGIEQSGEFGTVLGVLPGLKLTDSEVTIGRGDAILLYTDGVTEAGPRDSTLGQHGLEALLRRVGGDPQAIVDAVEAAVVAAQEGEPRDDVALLALGVPAE
ncbi:MAG TPA: GAF domain-containing SpoIIE family protein phosphatase, partial [Solirubrobacteraceae bacterium]|nr:GAF domain-containing SpoIIE family protein phosphatase [Solirubrobacteraceae bacterium]